MSFPWKSFEKRALAGGWSHRELQERILSEMGRKPFKTGVLRRSEGKFHHFRIAQKFSVNAKTDNKNGLAMVIEILEVYKGEKYNDTCIAELKIFPE